MASLLILLFPLWGPSLNHSSPLDLGARKWLWAILSFPYCLRWSSMYLGLFVSVCCSLTPGFLRSFQILGVHTIFKVIISPQVAILGKIYWGFSVNKGSGIELSYTKRKKKRADLIYEWFWTKLLKLSNVIKISAREYVSFKHSGGLNGNAII